MIASIAALCLMTAELLASELLFGHFLERRSFFLGALSRFFRNMSCSGALDGDHIQPCYRFGFRL